MPAKNDFTLGQIIRFTFVTTSKVGGAIAPSSGFEPSDFKIFKNDSVVSKPTTAGVTVSSSHAGISSLHRVRMDTSNNTDPDYWESGDYSLVLDPNDETIDGEAPTAVFDFSIENRYHGTVPATPADVDQALVDYDAATGTELAATQTTITDAIAGLNDISTADVDQALATYDAATAAELATTLITITDAIAGLNDISTGDVDQALATYDAATATELATTLITITDAIAGLNDISTGDVDQALTTYDAATATELATTQTTITDAIAGLTSPITSEQSAALLALYNLIAQPGKLSINYKNRSDYLGPITRGDNYDGTLQPKIAIPLTTTAGLAGATGMLTVRRDRTDVIVAELPLDDLVTIDAPSGSYEAQFVWLNAAADETAISDYKFDVQLNTGTGKRTYANGRCEIKEDQTR